MDPSAEATGSDPGDGKLPFLYHLTSQMKKNDKSQTNSEDVSYPFPYQCSFCKRSFTDSCQLKRHIVIHSGAKLFQCLLCEKAFTSNSFLKVHMRNHTGEKPFQCDFCEQSYTDSSQLIRHTRMHTGEKPYKCSVCDKAFALTSNLRRHFRMHSGEKPFACRLCDKAFAQKGHMLRHLRMHSGERNHTCLECKKSFALSSNLKRHMKLHDKSRVRRCQFCKVTFPDENGLNEHIKTHKGDKPYVCLFCSKHFIRNSHLVRHLRTHGLDARRNSDDLKNLATNSPDISDVLKEEEMSVESDGESSEEENSSNFSENESTSHESGVKSDDTAQNREDSKCAIKELPCFWCGKTFLDFGCLMTHTQEHYKDMNLRDSSLKTAMPSQFMGIPTGFPGVPQGHMGTIDVDTDNHKQKVFEFPRNDSTESVPWKDGTKTDFVNGMKAGRDNKPCGEEQLTCLWCGENFTEGCHLVSHIRRHVLESGSQNSLPKLGNNFQVPPENYGANRDAFDGNIHTIKTECDENIAKENISIKTEPGTDYMQNTENELGTLQKIYRNDASSSDDNIHGIKIESGNKWADYNINIKMEPDDDFVPVIKSEPT